MIEIKSDNELQNFPSFVVESVKKSIIETFAEVGYYFAKKKVPETFRKKGKRDGEPEWKPLSKATIVDRLQRRGGSTISKFRAQKGVPDDIIEAERKNVNILVDTGELINSFDVFSESFSDKENKLTIGTKLQKAVKHQFGDPTNTYKGKKSPIPQRKMIFITEKDNMEIMEILNDNLSENL